MSKTFLTMLEELVELLGGAAGNVDGLFTRRSYLSRFSCVSLTTRIVLWSNGDGEEMRHAEEDGHGMVVGGCWSRSKRSGPGGLRSRRRKNCL